MSRDRKGPKACASCVTAIESVRRRQERDIVNGHTTLTTMMAEGAYCEECGAEFRMTMRPEGCPNDRDLQCSTCQEAIDRVCAIVLERLALSKGHAPTDTDRRTDYTCCCGCDTHVKITTHIKRHRFEQVGQTDL